MKNSHPELAGPLSPPISCVMSSVDAYTGLDFCAGVNAGSSYRPSSWWPPIPVALSYTGWLGPKAVWSSYIGFAKATTLRSSPPVWI